MKFRPTYRLSHRSPRRRRRHIDPVALGMRLVLGAIAIASVVFLAHTLFSQPALPATARIETASPSSVYTALPVSATPISGETSPSPRALPAFAVNSEAEDPFLTLVNWDHPTTEEPPEDLVTLGEVFGEEVALTNSEGSINRTAGQAAREMFLDAAREGIGRYKISSAYRSVAYQDGLFERRLEQDPSYGSDPYNQPVKCVPGVNSEHTTGLAMDILSEAHETADDGYGDTAEGRWLAQNAHRYGFIQRYPSGKEALTGVIYEPWHYRYVGVEAATDIYARGLCLEEYLDTSYTRANTSD